MMMYNFLQFIYFNLPMIFNCLILFLMMIPIKYNNFHPLKLLIILIMIIFLISLKMSFIYKSWMNFIIFLIMIGGLMIIFMYITSLSSNMLFKFNLNSIYMNLFKFFFVLIFLMMMFYFMDLKLFILNYQDYLIMDMYMVEEINDYSLMKLFSKNNYSMIFIMMYLYLTLICIMNICYKMKSPLRQINF
uniref:NADH dehydrogenase subunit 6 n=1 Tax=Venturia canescens TaxID=32260 RepID=C4NCG9_9HYME|nr:NADH dehydrogenase subunit 6 [Venturia canescens]